MGNPIKIIISLVFIAFSTLYAAEGDRPLSNFGNVCPQELTAAQQRLAIIRQMDQERRVARELELSEMQERNRARLATLQSERQLDLSGVTDTRERSRLLAEYINSRNIDLPGVSLEEKLDLMQLIQEAALSVTITYSVQALTAGVKGKVIELDRVSVKLRNSQGEVRGVYIAGITKITPLD